MIPILFEHDATEFTGHGLGDLVDTISCIVKQNETNEFELELKYPVTGRLFSELTPNRIIYAKVNNNKNTAFTLSPQTLPYQAFRIYGYEKELAGYISIKAQHISYDLANVFIMPYDKTYATRYNYYGKPYDNASGHVYSPSSLITMINDSSYLISGTNQFTISAETWSTIRNKAMSVMEPRSVRSLLFDSDNSLVANFGGICCYDNFKLRFYSGPGNQISTTIEYGDDLIDFQQEHNIAEMVTGIIPYYMGKDPRYEDDSEWGGPDSIIYGQPIYAEGTFEHPVVVPVDVSSDISRDGKSGGGYDTEYDSVTGKMIYIPEVDTYGQRVAQNSELGVPEVSISLDYAHIHGDIKLYDIVRVYFKKLGIDVKAMVSSTSYDSLAERTTSVEIGRSKEYRQYYDFGNAFRGTLEY